MILQLTDRPIAFQRSFVRMTGSITAALMLSQAVYWQNRCDGWFYKTMAEWEEETGLSRSEQESARKRLRDLGVLEEEKRGIPAKIYFRVNEEHLQARLQESCKLGRGKPATCDAENPQPLLRESCNLNKEAETTTETTAESTHIRQVSARVASLPKTLAFVAPARVTPVNEPPDLDEISRAIVCAHPWSLERKLTPMRVPADAHVAVIEAIMHESELHKVPPDLAAEAMLRKVQELVSTVPRPNWRWFAYPARFFRNGDYHLPPERFKDAQRAPEASYAERAHIAEEERIRQLRRERAERSAGR